jgi:hypothetical protein
MNTGIPVQGVEAFGGHVVGHDSMRLDAAAEKDALKLLGDATVWSHRAVWAPAANNEWTSRHVDPGPCDGGVPRVEEKSRKQRLVP